VADGSASEGERLARDRGVRRVLLVEGAVNLLAIAVKVAVGVSTGSSVVLADAVHSATDVANNAVALVAARLASAPPDREHPYGHRKFETLAVFGLAVLLSVLAVEVAQSAFHARDREVLDSAWGLPLLVAMLVLHVCTSVWQQARARALDSDLLRADAWHTASDALTTAGVIAGWQLAAAGWLWLDAAFTFGIAVLILWLAFGLFRRAVPGLVEGAAEDPARLASVVSRVPGVRATRQVRSAPGGGGTRVDVVVSVDPELSTRDSHAIADRIERVLEEEFAARDVNVHVEPDLPQRR